MYKYTIVPWILWESEHNLLQKRFICSHLCGGLWNGGKNASSEQEDPSLVLQIPCEKLFLGTQNPLQNHLQKGLEHKGMTHVIFNS